MVIESPPSIFTASTIANVRFQLDVRSSPPLHFQPLDSMTKIRQQSLVEASPSTTLDELVHTPGALSMIVQDLTTVKTTAGTHSTEEAGRFGQIALALLLLGHGYTDECHNLITPLSWPDDVYFAAGPSVYNEMAPDVQAFATYTHCLVHRKEAFNVGEFGMVGFANANYWSNAVQRLEGVSALPHAEWHTQMTQLGSKPEFSKNPLIQAWCRQHGFVPKRTTPYYFDSKALHGLCATVIKAAETNDPDRASLKLFAEQAVASEIRILLNKALERAGITVDNGTVTEYQVSTDSGRRGEEYGSPLVVVHADLAVRVMNRISSAHRDNFLTNRCIILRRVAVMVEDMVLAQTKEIIHASLVSGITCRLLHCPACKIQNSSPCLNNSNNHDGLCVLIPLNDQATIELATRIRRPNDLCVVDVFAVQLAPGQALDEMLQNIDGVQYWYLEPCLREDPQAVFVDPLFGSRGETPTTVIQWSKGTIF